jgi:hypothetical protein
VVSVLSRWRKIRAERRRIVKRERAETRAQLAEEKAAAEDAAYADRVVKRHEKTKAYLAVKFAHSRVGVKESPAGSNRGPWVDKFQAAFGDARGYAWCGAFVGWAAKKAGLRGLTDRVLYVPFIIADGRAGKNGFDRFVDARDVQLGDFVCMDFGGSPVVGEHVGIARGGAYRIGPNWFVPTIEGNTSSSESGSQSNGGMVAERSRPVSVIVGCARPRWNG